jgi:hypothetical protein
VTKIQAFGVCVHEFGTDSPIEWVGGEDYVNTFLESIGHEPQCWRTTHSSMYPLWSGTTTHTLPSSSTHYQWARALRGVEVGNSLAKLAKDF